MTYVQAQRIITNSTTPANRTILTISRHFSKNTLRMLKYPFLFLHLDPQDYRGAWWRSISVPTARE
jgi:hypothetical protein